MSRISPTRLLRIPELSDSEQFLFEPKTDGFRALAFIEHGRCTLVSPMATPSSLALPLRGGDAERRESPDIPRRIEARGVDLFRAACERDLEGIMGNWRFGSYCTEWGSTFWMKIKNTSYSQMEGRAELFDRAPRRRIRTTTPTLDLYSQDAPSCSGGQRTRWAFFSRRRRERLIGCQPTSEHRSQR